jgi:hypothetical protein
VLGGSALVVASLVTLVALFGPVIVLTEGWLDARLPHAAAGDGRIVAGYGVVTLLGSFLTLFAVVPAYLGSEDLRLAGIALAVVGGATLASWRYRVIERPLPALVTPLARLAIVGAVIAGSAVALAEVSGAIGRA